MEAKNGEDFNSFSGKDLTANPPTKLLFILDHFKKWKSHENEDLLLKACQRVGHTLGLQFNQHETEADDLEERLQELCFHSQIYYRKVNLLGNWQQYLSTSLVAFYGKNKIPVAVVITKKGGGEIIHPDYASPIELSEAHLKELSPFGYMFYRNISTSFFSIGSICKFLISTWHSEWLTFLFLILCTTLVNLAFPTITLLLFDEVIPYRNEDLLLQIALGALAISLSSLVFQFGRETLLLRIQGLSDHDLEMGVWLKLVQLPVSFFKKHNLYDLFTCTQAVSTIRKELVSHTIEVLFNSFFSFFYLILMFYYSWPLALVGLGIIGVRLIGTAITFYYGMRYGREYLEEEIHASNKMLELVHALTKVRLAGAENRMFSRWQEAFSKMMGMESKVLSLHLKSTVFNQFWSNAGVWILYLGAFIILIKNPSFKESWHLFSLGSFMAFFSAFNLLNHAFEDLGETLLSMIQIIPLWDKTKLLAEAEPEAIGKAEPGLLEGNIRIENISFRYQPDLPLILDNIHLSIKAGESVAIVGTSGCGKSSLLKLLLGFEAPSSGSIFYDDNDMRNLNVQSIRKQMGVVLQSGGIFDGTIEENVCCGRYYNAEQVHYALEAIGAGKFIEKLPMGIRTLLTNSGAALSGGQRQLILLARAVVGNPKILILDEATSALDNRKQRKVYDLLSKLSMTKIIVAQCLDTIQGVDKIYIIDQGKIIEEGTFSDLVSKGGLFSKMVVASNLV